MKPIRCAIYTRKSNDEGLEKEFNTLKAQREAGENYIRSQIHQGWQLIEKHYDDGGYSGGTMKRPALQELLADIKAGQVDMIVVYKIDRLSRSLMDFSQMIDILDKYNCSFISVTQNFNTADSMGRLMLNVLLSFAQFEREISGERIRDKIAATRKKGMWTGGRVPFGYKVENKKLLIYPPFAQIVKHIFERYAEVPSEVMLAQELNNTNVLAQGDAQYCNFNEFQPSLISSIITNPIYMGKLKVKKELYDGVHKAIVSADLFQKVNALKEQKHKNVMQSNEQLHGLLKGLLRCGCCNTPLDVKYAKRKNRKYKYYTCRRASERGYNLCELKQINAGELEALVIEHIKPLFTHPAFIQELAHLTKQECPSCQEAEVFDAMHSFEDVFQGLTLSGQQEVLKTIIDEITVFKDTVIIRFNAQVAELLSPSLKAKLTKGTYDLPIPYSVHNRAGKTCIVNANGCALTKRHPDQSLIKALARSFQWTKVMEDTKISQTALAEQENINKGYLGKIMRLTILAPDIIQSILDGTQPAHITVDTFMRTTIPYRWEEQRKKFGFITG